jgi:hypothetical protein
MKRGQEIQTDRQAICMCNVTFSYVRVTIVTVEVQ